MSAILGIAKGADAAYYTQASRGPSYYARPAGERGSEPEGVWTGDGGAALGFAAAGAVVDGEVFAQLYGQHVLPDGTRLGHKLPVYADGPKGYQAAYERLLEGEPYATAERRDELRIQARAETVSAVPFWDLTFAVGKSTTLLHASATAAELAADEAGDAAGAAAAHKLAETVWSAIMAGNQAALDHMQKHAGYTRSGSHVRRVGEQTSGRWEDAHRWVVASWRQHSSRAGDPSLHVHNTVLNKVQRERDGEWRTLDGKALYRERAAASAIGALVMESALTRDLGVAWEPRPDGHGREIAGVPEALVDEFSRRARADIEPELARRVQAWRDIHDGRDPDSHTLHGLRQSISRATRGAKSEPMDLSAEVRAWAQRARRADGAALEALHAQVCGNAQGAGLSAQAERDLMSRALAQLQGRQSTFTRSDLTRAIGELLPAGVIENDPHAAVELLPKLTSRALAGEAGTVVALAAPEWPVAPNCLRRADGESVFAPHYATRYATTAQLDMEERIRNSAAARSEAIPHLEPQRAAELLGADAELLQAQLNPDVAAEVGTNTGSGLHLDQAAAAFRILTSTRRAEVMVGPAGTGKSRTVAVMARAWAEAKPHGRVLAVTTTQRAAHVLREEGLTDSHNISMFLADSRLQELPADSLIFIDEGSTVSMPHYDILMRMATAANAKLVVTGDPQQLGAVASGGGMTILARQEGWVQLGEPLRYHQEWQRSASLRLRAGDASVLPEYDQQGLILGGSREQMMEEGYRRWLADHMDGRHSVLIAHDEADAAEMARRARGDLIRYGRVAQDGRVALRENAVASAGDRIMARKNQNRMWTGIEGRGLTNRDVLEVLDTEVEQVSVRLLLGRGHDGSAGERWGPAFPIDRAYLQEQCHLAYAVTAHSVQGTTFADNSYTLVGPSDDRKFLYSGMSRARRSNYALVTCEPRQPDTDGAPSGDPEISREHRLALERAGESPDQAEVSAEPLGVLAAVLQRDDPDLSASEVLERVLSDADHLGILAARWLDITREAAEKRYAAALTEILPERHVKSVQEDTAHTWLYRSLRTAELAGLDGVKVLRQAAVGELDSARDPARVLDHRVRNLIAGSEPKVGISWAHRVPEVADPDLTRYLGELADAMDARTTRLGEHVRDTLPRWAERALGPVPDDAVTAEDWQRRAAAVAAYREISGYANPADPIGPQPSVATPEMRAAWQGALASMAADGIDLASLSDEDLTLRRGTYQPETSWAPPYVARELRLARLAQSDAATRAARAAHEAEASEEAVTRERHQALEASWLALELTASDLAAGYGRAMETRRQWAQVTESTRRVAIAADLELRRRHLELALPPLRSAEPDQQLVQDAASDTEALAVMGLTPDGDAAAAREHLARVSQAASSAQAKLDELATMLEPDLDEDVAPSEAWSTVVGRQRESVLQLPDRMVPPPSQVTRAERQAEAAQ